MSHKSVADEIDPVTAAELGHPHHQQQQHPLHHRHQQQHNTPPPIQQSVMSAAADEVLGSISGTMPESTDIAADHHHQQKLMNDEINKLAIDAEKVVAHVRARGTEAAAAAPDVQTPIDSNNNSNSRDEEVGHAGLKTNTVMMTVVAAKQEKDALLGEVDIKDVAEVVTFPNNGSPAVGHGMETTTTTTSTKASPPTTTTTTTTRRRVFVADEDAKEEQDKERQKNEAGECSGKTDDKAVQCNSAEESAIMLQDWKEMPRYLQFNPYVLTGYRPLQNVSECFASLFYFHNETFNILTHGE